MHALFALFRPVMAAAVLGLAHGAVAQNVGINANGAAPHPSAMLDVDVSAIAGTKRGLLIPRVTSAQRVAIPSPATSLLVFDTTTNSFWYFDGTVWVGNFVEVDPTWDGSAVFTGASWRSGDLGLGMTAAPNSKLQVVGRAFIDNSANAHAIAGNPALTADGALNEDILRIRDVGANNRLLVNSAGLVGISTSTPTARLSIATLGSQAELGGMAASATFKSNTGPLGNVAGNSLKLASIGFTSTLENVSLGVQALRTANGTSSATTAIGLKFDVDATSPVNNSEIWLTNGGNIGIGTSAPHASALLDVDATALPAASKRGLLIPRMTTAERTAIATPATGLLVYDSSLNAFWFYDGTAWSPLSGTEVDPTWDGSAVFTGASWRSGDLGLGMTAAPNSKLQVVGRVFIDNSANAHAIAGNPALTVDGALSEDILRVRDVGANNRLLVTSGGLVGISTSIPTARLSIATIGSQAELGGAAASTTFKSNTGSLGTIAGNTLKLASFGFTTNGVTENVSLGIEALRMVNGTTVTTSAIGLKFDMNATSPLNNSEIWLTNAGNIGIGTNAPTAVLDVNGKARSTAIYSFDSSTGTTTTTSTVLVNHAGLVTTLAVQTNDIVKVDCACNLSNSTAAGVTYLTVDITAGAGTWVQVPNSVVSTGTGFRGGYSTGILQATADGNITFQAQWRVGVASTGSTQACNITAVVIGKQ